jgi:hypothetical protein
MNVPHTHCGQLRSMMGARVAACALALLSIAALSACSEPSTPARDGDTGGGSGDAGAGDVVAGDIDAGGGDATPWGHHARRPNVAKAAGSGPLKVGVAMRYIDGPVGVSMAGYGGRNDGRQTHWSDKLKGSAGCYGFQTIKAVVIEAGDERIAFVKSPTMSSESYLTDAVARQLDSRHKLDFKGRVITMAGHSHHTTARYWPLPSSLGSVGADSFDPEVAETVAGQIADAIADAWAGRVDGEWAHAQQDDWDPKDDVYRDRRGENDALYGKDPRLGLLAFRAKKDATPLAVIIHFPIHGTVFGGDNDMLTEDAPGYVEHKFEELFFAQKGKPVFGMFAQSAGGDASPAGDSLGHPPLARLERLGEAAAPRILALYDAMSWSATAELAIRSQRIELVHDRLYKGKSFKGKSYQDEFANEFNGPYFWGGWQCAGSGVKAGETMEGKAKLCVDLGKFLSLLEAPMPHGEAHQVYLTAARIGDVWMITMPGEPAWSVVKYAREAAAKKTWNGKPMNLMVLGYSQDHLLYLTTPDDWFLGGYEAEMSLWGPGGGVFLADEGLALVDDMAAGLNAPTFFEESASLSPPPQWTPRPRERSLKAGDVVVVPAAEVARTQTVAFAVNCGDPGLGTPLLQVQRKDGATFVDLPAHHGWKGRHYDNSRYEIVSVYDPDPPQAKHKSLPERTHLWRFYWQVPPAWPLGSYRLHLRCDVHTDVGGAAKTETLAVDSAAFAVVAAPGLTLEAAATATTLTLKLRVSGVAQVETNAVAPARGRWASAGYRLLDYDVKHNAPALVRSALKVEILDEAGTVTATLDAPFDTKLAANVATLPTPAPSGKWTVRAWIAADATAAKVAATPTQ